MVPLLTSVTPPAHAPFIVSASVPTAVEDITTPVPIVATTGIVWFHPAATASVRKFAFVWFAEIVNAKEFVLPCRLFIPITPLATPARVRTAVSFRLISAVAVSPSSTFT
jgi:hypothetical protein